MSVNSTEKRPIVAIDFDGTIHDYKEEKWPDLGEPFVGADEFLRAIHKKYDIVIWSGRCSGIDGGAPVRYWLRKHNLMGLIKDVTDNLKSCNPVMIIDDRARRCDGNKHYAQIMEELDV